MSNIDKNIIQKIKYFCCMCCCEEDTNDISPVLNSSVSVKSKKIFKKQPTSERKRKSISASLRIKIWKNIFGDPPTFETICPICDNNKMLMDDGTSWEVSHIVSFANGGDEEIENLRPICKQCNRSMSNKHMKDFIIERQKQKGDEKIKLTFKILKL